MPCNLLFWFFCTPFPSAEPRAQWGIILTLSCWVQNYLIGLVVLLSCCHWVPKTRIARLKKRTTSSWMGTQWTLQIGYSQYWFYKFSPFLPHEMALHGCDMDCYLYWCLLCFPEAENPSQWQDSGWCQFSPCWCYCNEWSIDDRGCYLFRNCLPELKFISLWPWIEGFSSCCSQLLFPRLLVHLICILEKMKYGVMHCYNMQSCSSVMIETVPRWHQYVARFLNGSYFLHVLSWRYLAASCVGLETLLLYAYLSFGEYSYLQSRRLLS